MSRCCKLTEFREQAGHLRHWSTLCFVAPLRHRSIQVHFTAGSAATVDTQQRGLASPNPPPSPHPGAAAASAAMAALLDDGPLRQTVWENTYRLPEQLEPVGAGAAAPSPLADCTGLPATLPTLSTHSACCNCALQDARFRQQQAQRVLRELLAERLTGVAYDPVRMSQLTKQLAGANCGSCHSPRALLWAAYSLARHTALECALPTLSFHYADDIRERVKALGLER